jgi:hypothetical protein
MSITINGNGTISGYEPVPNGSITSAKLASGVGGKVLQYKQYQAVGSHSTTSTSWVSISSDFEFDLPNVQTNSNVLIHLTATKGTTTTDVVRFKIVRVKGGVSTDLGMNTTADYAGRTATMMDYIGGDMSNQIYPTTMTWWDMDPGGDGSTTITYKIQWIAASGQTIYLGQSSPASVQQRSGGTQAYVMEFAA